MLSGNGCLPLRVEDPEKVKEHVGRKIAELRDKKGVTQADVAEAIGTTVPNLQRIEYGTQNVTIETLTKIANAIGVHVADFFRPIDRRTRQRRRGRPPKNLARRPQ